MNTAANIPPPGAHGKRFLQIVPAGGGGVNDYAAMLQQHGLTGDLLRAAKPIPVDWAGYDAVLLQYSGYGYARRGAPLWVLQWLRQEKRHIRRLGVFFHELYAMGPPWRSEFWVSPLQRYVARELAALSDFWLTNRQASANWLNAGGAHPLHAVLPTSSGVGELSVPNLIRKPYAIVFGGAGLRAATYRAHGAKLSQWARESGLELHDVGPTVIDPHIQSFLLQSNVVVHGRLPAVELSELLRHSTLGVLSYPLPYASKSSVLGAYCAHGLCPVIFPDSAYPGDSLDGLRHGINFIDGTHLRHLQLSQICEIGKHAWDWYGNHTVQRHVSAITSMGLKGVTDEC